MQRGYGTLYAQKCTLLARTMGTSYYTLTFLIFIRLHVSIFLYMRIRTRGHKNYVMSIISSMSLISCISGHNLEGRREEGRKHS